MKTCFMITIKKIIKIVLISIPFTILGTIIYPSNNQEILINIYNAFLSIIGVLFSISIGIILSFSFNKIKNKRLSKIYINKITGAKNLFTIYFILAIINEIISLLIYKNIINIYKKIYFNMGLFGLINFIIIVSMIIANYNSLYKSKIEFDADFLN